MKLIDADALIAQLKCDTKDCDKCPANDYWFGCGKIKEFIDNAPTIDAIPVVRCKDCKYWGEVGTVCRKLDNVMFWYGTDPTDFCSFAERRDDE